MILNRDEQALSHCLMLSRLRRALSVVGARPTNPLSKRRESPNALAVPMLEEQGLSSHQSVRNGRRFSILGYGRGTVV